MKPSLKIILGGLVIAASFSPFSADKAHATCNSNPYISTICWTSAMYCPSGYAQANGQVLSVMDHQPLFSLIGATYGGDGRTTFALPDLRGRAAIGTGQAPGLANVTLGQKVGAEEYMLQIKNLPPHSHSIAMGSMPLKGTVTGVEDTGTVASPSDAFPASRPDSGAPNGRKAYYTQTASKELVKMASDAVTLSANPPSFNTEKAFGGDSYPQQALPLRSPQVGVLACIAIRGDYPTR